MNFDKDSFNYCDHIRGTFIGIQHDPINNGCFALFICDHCRSTYSMPMTPEFESLNTALCNQRYPEEQRIAV
ncbi:MAG: hypothetical protein H8E46_06135 [FCB group bacterium]|nr:hypothetical protein [FCB group bacterium]